MSRLSLVSLAAAALIVVISLPAMGGTVSCSECGMAVDLNSKFIARMTEGDTLRYFCDIGDLFSYVKRKSPRGATAEVKDYTTGEWLPSRQAFYVQAGKRFKTPMGWGIAAFRDKARAAEYGDAMDFDMTAKALK